MPDNNDSNSDDDSRFLGSSTKKLPPELQDAVFDEKNR